MSEKIHESLFEFIVLNNPERAMSVLSEEKLTNLELLTKLGMLMSLKNYDEAIILLEEKLKTVTFHENEQHESALIKARTFLSSLQVPSYDWYQNQNQVVITYKIKNAFPMKVNCQIKEDGKIIKFYAMDSKTGVSYYHVLKLGDFVDSQMFGLDVKSMKVEISLNKKTPGLNWLGLTATSDETKPFPVTVAPANKVVVPPPTSSVTINAPPSRETAINNNNNNNIKTPASSNSLPAPYATKKDWNKIEKEIEKEVASEKPEGDEALQKLFKEIYANADEDTRRAMNKSYQTSGGTVLTTNWKEAKEKDFEKTKKAPKGQVWKDWEGNIIADDQSDEEDSATQSKKPKERKIIM